jgi:hypothetical protein
LDVSFICWLRIFRVVSVFSGDFIAEEVDRGEDKGSGDTTTVDVQTLLEAFFEHVPEICLLQ